MPTPAPSVTSVGGRHLQPKISHRDHRKGELPDDGATAHHPRRFKDTVKGVAGFVKHQIGWGKDRDPFIISSDFSSLTNALRNGKLVIFIEIKGELTKTICKNHSYKGTRSQIPPSFWRGHLSQTRPRLGRPPMMVR